MDGKRLAVVGCRVDSIVNGELAGDMLGAKGVWNKKKQIDFTATGNGVLEITGRNYEGGGCTKSGSFAITCKSEDMFWGSFSSDSAHIKAASGASSAGDDFGGLCAANGGNLNI